MKRIIEMNIDLNEKYDLMSEMKKFNIILISFGTLSLLSILFKFTWVIPIIAIILVLSRGVYLYGLEREIKDENNTEKIEN